MAKPIIGKKVQKEKYMNKYKIHKIKLKRIKGIIRAIKDEEVKPVALRGLLNYKIGDKPEGLGQRKYKGKWNDLVELIQKIDSTKTIQVTLKELGYKDFRSLYNSLRMAGNKRGVKIGIEEINGIIHIFPR